MRYYGFCVLWRSGCIWYQSRVCRSSTGWRNRWTCWPCSPATRQLPDSHWSRTHRAGQATYEGGILKQGILHCTTHEEGILKQEVKNSETWNSTLYNLSGENSQTVNPSLENLSGEVRNAEFIIRTTYKREFTLTHWGRCCTQACDSQELLLAQ